MSTGATASDAREGEPALSPITTDTVRELLADRKIFPGVPADLGEDTELVLDSLGLVWLLHVVEERFGLVVEPTVRGHRRVSPRCGGSPTICAPRRRAGRKGVVAMSGEVTVTGFGVRTAFGTGADALRRGVFAGVPSFAATTRFDTGPYRTAMAAAAADGPGAVEGWALRHALAECGDEALDMAGLRPGAEAAVLLGVAGDHTSVTRYWRGVGSDGSRGSDVAGRAVPRAPEARCAGPPWTRATPSAPRRASTSGERVADAVPARLAELLAGDSG